MTWETSFALAAGDHLWQSTLFAAVAALLAASLRKNRAQTRYLLWLIASVKFLVPFSLLIGLGAILKWFFPLPAVRPTFSVAIDQISRPFDASQTLLPVVSGSASVPPSLLPGLLVTLWLVGSVVVLLSWLRRWMRVQAIVRTAAPLPIATELPVLSSSSLFEPGVFGVFRPVLLLPAGITSRLTAAHLRAIFAHEFCHVRRRDNLAAAVHMLVQALFWFHPLVWWMGARLLEEREHACDEEVLRLGSKPEVYAESILKICQLYHESPLVCVSGVTGSDLTKRLVRIMTQGMAARLNFRKKVLLAAAAIAALAVPLAIGLTNAKPSHAQSQPTVPGSAFEVASVKPSKPDAPGMFLRIQPGGRFSASGVTVKLLLEEAYNVKDAQVAQAPPWVNSDRYDIDAKPDDALASVIDKLPPEERRAKMTQMIQSLLAERFKLALGHETKELAVYALVTAKNGPKLKESTFRPPDKLPASLPPIRKGGPPPPGSLRMEGPGQLVSTGVELSMLANILSRVTGRIVLDKTGLRGRYDYTLHWTPDESQGPMLPGGPRATEGGPPPESSGPSLFTAVQEQLGLKLESQKAPLDVLVIEHIEKPSEN